MTTRAKLQFKTPEPVTQRPEPSAAATAKAERRERPDSENKRMIGGHFHEATWERLRHLGVDKRRTTQELLEEALSDLFDKYRR